MVYLIFDTNIWLYLSNGYDPISNSYQKGVGTNAHFELLENLKAKIAKKEITILVNEIIFSEFERNQQTAQALIGEINKFSKHLLKNIKELKPFIKDSSYNFLNKEIKAEISTLIASKLEKNTQHIAEVKSFLKDDCTVIPISDWAYIETAKFAINKQAPFHKNKNNAADSVILLSAFEYLKAKPLGELETAIFVSNNIAEYAAASVKNEIQFHNDIVQLLAGTDIRYKRHLSEAIQLSDSIIEDMKYYLDFAEEQMADRKFTCLLPYCHNYEELEVSFGYFDALINVLGENDFYYNPNQLSLFEFTDDDKIAALKRIPQTFKGACNVCNTVHVVCPNCSELMCDPESWDDFYCNGCESVFSIVPHERLKMQVLVERLDRSSYGISKD